jgi:hypothetical protein
VIERDIKRFDFIAMVQSSVARHGRVIR